MQLDPAIDFLIVALSEANQRLARARHQTQALVEKAFPGGPPFPPLTDCTLRDAQHRHWLMYKQLEELIDDHQSLEAEEVDLADRQSRARTALWTVYQEEAQLFYAYFECTLLVQQLESIIAGVLQRRQRT